MKKNLLIHFAESPNDITTEEGLIEYSTLLNLTVLKGTNAPAVTFSEEATETFTKSDGEGSDSDRDLYNKILKLTDTETNTYGAVEESDSDRGTKFIGELVSTRTITERVEATDEDK